MKKLKKVPVWVISIILSAAMLFGSIPAVSAGEGSYAKYGDAYCVAHMSEELPEDYFDSFGPEIDELLDLYVKHSLYELTREEAVVAMLKTFLSEYYSILPYMGDSLLKAFDSFGGYYSSTSVSEIFEGESYTGYGVIMESQRIEDARGYQPVVKHVILNSPADMGGIKKGDEFIAINDINVEGFGIEAVSNLMSSTKGTTKFTLRRGDEEVTAEIVKGRIQYETVSYEIIDESAKLALVTIANFTDDSLILQLSAILGVLEEDGYENLIIDLRDNLGGNLDYLYEVVDFFVPKENVKLGSIVFRDGEKEDVMSTDYGFKFDNICVLTNEYTASAAEAFALALSELRDAKVIGGVTYGKGIGQSYIEMTNGDIAAITSLELVSPEGNKYHGDGITPDIEVEQRYKREDMPFDEREYEQLNFVNCTSIKRDADNKVVLGLNQRLARIGYIEPADVSSQCTQKTVTAVEIFQTYCGLPKGIEKIDYEFLEYLSYFVSRAPTIAISGDAQMDCAVKFMLEGEKAAKEFAKEINEQFETLKEELEKETAEEETEETEDEDEDEDIAELID